jgi:hypothetical protein
VDEKAMDEFLRLVDARLGGTRTWLVDNGMRPEALTALTSQLVQPGDEDFDRPVGSHPTQ